MDDKIVDFGKLKNKVRDKDINDFEGYMYDLYFKMSEGKMNMMEFTTNITSYMQKNNISQEKFMNIQKEMLGRYGLDMNNLDESLKNMGIDPSTLGSIPGMPTMPGAPGVDAMGKAYEDLRKTIGFQEKYKSRLGNKALMTYKIKNDSNDIEIQLEGNNILIKSIKDINLQDVELNEFLCSYKKTLENQTLNIELCSNVQNFIY